MIKATELAKWASANVSGLEGVQAYHFLRKVREKDPKTGRTIEVLRPCTKKINELNAIRNVAAVIEENPLINSSSLDAFFKYPRDEQRQMIINTRMQIEKLKAHNQYLSKENLRYRNENDSLHEKEETLLNMLEQIKSEQEHLSSVLKVMTTYIDERTRKDALATAGITNGDFDFKKYQENMSVSIEKAFSIIREGAGSHFDPEIVEVFFAAQDEIQKTKEMFDRMESDQNKPDNVEEEVERNR